MTVKRRSLLLAAALIGIVALLVVQLGGRDPSNLDALRSAPPSYERCVTSIFSRALVSRRSIVTKEISEGAAIPGYLPEGFLLVSGSRSEAGPVWADDDCNIIAMFSGQGPDVPESEPQLGRWVVSERPHATTFPCPARSGCWVLQADFRDVSFRLETAGIDRAEAMRVARSISR